ncbi:hypothetical protein NDA11_005902 [Ustilago hordei]|nr:hypothetical protein NDA11_005902 [Ustilago hordei]KAJ1599254.1 hypothetical protein NDA14_005277 [Ustilago hordei]
MGNIISRHSSDVIDSFVLRLARVIDSVLRNINRRLSNLSSFFFSRVFGYDVAFTADPTTNPTTAHERMREAGGLMCGPGNLCLVPASKLQQRQLEKKRRSERRKRAEAAALGHDMIRKARGGEKGKYEKVDSTPSSPVLEKAGYRQWEMTETLVQQSMGEVARAPAARAVEERETVGEREKGKLWVIGNVQPSHSHTRRNSGGKRLHVVNEGLPGEKTVDEQVFARLRSPTSPSRTLLDVNDKASRPVHIQPRKSSRPPPPLVAAKIDAVVEKHDTAAEGGLNESGHLTTKKPLHQPTALRLPPGALSLGPSPWEPAFRHPFSPDHEALTSKAKQHLPRHVKLDTHLESSPLPNATAAFIPSPLHPQRHDDENEDEDEVGDETSHLATGIIRPPSRTRTPGGGMPRSSFDAVSLRSIDSTHTGTGVGAIDVKTLASKAVKEERGRKMWKDQVNKFAMQRCLQQQVLGERRLSTATLSGAGVVGMNGVSDKALTPVPTQEGEGGGERGLGGANGRRESSPALGIVTAGMAASTSIGTNGRTTPASRAESPLHAVTRS